MDVKVTSTGKVFYQVDAATAAMLMEAFPASFERAAARPAPAAPAPPTWGIGTGTSGYVHIVYKAGGQTTSYSGPPDNAVDGFKIRRWSGEKQAHVFEGPEPPLEIIEQYRQQWAPRPIMSYTGPKD
jgi:hypothetical protein